MDTIGSRLRSMREVVEGLSPAKLGRLAHLKSPSHVGMLERGERGAGISADSALSLAKVLGCTAEYLVNGEGKAPTAKAIRAAVARADVASDSTLRTDPDEPSTEIVRDSRPAVA